nr:hypothetical protein [Hephaestia mangrovi]
MLIWLDEIRERLSIPAQLRRCEQQDRKRGSKAGYYCDYTKRSVPSFTVSPPPVKLSQWLVEARRCGNFPNLRAVFSWRRRGWEVDRRKITGQFFTGGSRLAFFPDADRIATAARAQSSDGGRDVPIDRVRRDAKTFPDLRRIEMIGDAFDALPLSARQRAPLISTHNGTSSADLRQAHAKTIATSEDRRRRNYIHIGSNGSRLVQARACHA